jgi:hypothetical protein
MFVPGGGVNGLELSLVHLDGNNIGTYGWCGDAGNKARLLNVLVDRFTKCGVYFNQGLCELRQSYVRFNPGIGVRASSDGWISGTEIGSNGGAGLVVAGGGNRISDNLINSNGSYGIHITGQYAGNLINSVIGGYLGENVGQNIMIEGISPANRNVGYTSIIGCFIQQTGPKRAGELPSRQPGKRRSWGSTTWPATTTPGASGWNHAIRRRSSAWRRRIRRATSSGSSVPTMSACRMSRRATTRRRAPAWMTASRSALIPAVTAVRSPTCGLRTRAASPAPEV